MRFGIMISALDWESTVAAKAHDLYLSFRKAKLDVNMYTSNGESSSGNPVYHYADIRWSLSNEDDLLVYFYGGADPSGFIELKRARCRLTLGDLTGEKPDWHDLPFENFDLAKPEMLPTQLAGIQLESKSTITYHEHEWFGLPKLFVTTALAEYSLAPSRDLTFRSRRIDLVDWALRDGHKRSVALRKLIRSDHFREYAESIEVPPAAAYFSPTMRLVWAFNRFANITFSLLTADSARSFARWYNREQLYPEI